MVFGFWGLISKLCRSQASTIGEQPAACAPLILVPRHSTNPSQASSFSPLYILLYREPLARGTMQ